MNSQVAINESGGEEKKKRRKRRAAKPKTQTMNCGDGVIEETTGVRADSTTIVTQNGVLIAKIVKAKGNYMDIHIPLACGRMSQQVTLGIGATLGPEGLIMDTLGGGKYCGTTIPPLHEATIRRGNISTNGLPRVINGCTTISNFSIVRTGRGGMISHGGSGISIGGVMMGSSSGGRSNYLNGITIDNGSYSSSSSGVLLSSVAAAAAEDDSSSEDETQAAKKPRSSSEGP